MPPNLINFPPSGDLTWTYSGKGEKPKYSRTVLQLTANPSMINTMPMKAGWAGLLNPLGKLWPNWLSGFASHLWKQEAADQCCGSGMFIPDPGS